MRYNIGSILIILGLVIGFCGVLTAPDWVKTLVIAYILFMIGAFLHERK